MTGKSLVFESVGRAHIGTYLCIASNGVPPSVSKRVQLRVQCENYFIINNRGIIMVSCAPNNKISVSCNFVKELIKLNTITTKLSSTLYKTNCMFYL